MAANIGSASSLFDPTVIFKGDPEEAETIQNALKFRLAQGKVSRAIREPNNPPNPEDYKGNRVKYRDAVESHEDRKEAAFLILLSAIGVGTPLSNAVAHVVDRKDPAELFNEIKQFYASKTVAKALDIVTAILRLMCESRTKREVSTISLSKLYNLLNSICTPSDIGVISAEQTVERSLLVAKVFFELSPYAMQMLNERHVLYAAPFIQQHINTIQRDLCDVDFRDLSKQYIAYCATSVEYRAQQLASTSATDASGSKKRANEAPAEDSSDSKRLVKVLTAALNTALDGRGLGVGGGGRGTGKASRGGRGAGKQTTPPTLIPVSERCDTCVKSYQEKHPGTALKDVRVNHSSSQCKRLGTTPRVHANMAIVAPQPAVAAFMAELEDVGNLLLHTHKFYIDSGSNAVIINRYYRHLMYDSYDPTSDASIEGIGNEGDLRFELIGKIRFMGEELRCVYAPQISKSVLGVSVLCSTGKFKLVFDDDYVIVINKRTKATYKAKYSHELLYEMNTTLHSLFEQTVATIAMLASVRPINQFDLWHARLGHVHEDMIRYMSSSSIYQERGLKITDKSFASKERDLCSTCALAKPTRSRSHAAHRRHPIKGRLWYMDVSGPFVVESLIHKSRYIIIFVDSNTRMIFDYYTKEVDADSILVVLRQFNAEVLSSVMLDGDIIFIQSDNGQMKSDAVIAYIRRNNIMNRFSYPYHPAMNPLAERSFRSIKEMGRCQLEHASLPDPYWEFSCSCAVFILNILPNQTPDGTVREAYYLWTGLTFDYSLLRTFGARSYAINQIVANDFGARSEEGIFVGFDKGLVSILRMIYLPSKNTCVPAGDGQMSEHVGRPRPERLLPPISVSDREYTLADFTYLNGTLHRDPHEAVNYKVIKVYVHKGLIVVDRVLYDTSSPSTKRKTYDTIHARDVATYPMIDDRGELLHIVADNALSAMIPVPAAGTHTQAVNSSYDIAEKGNTQPSLISSVKNNIISSEDVNNIISDEGSLSTSHSKTTEETGSAHTVGVPYADAAQPLKQHSSSSSVITNKNKRTNDSVNNRTHLRRDVNRKTKTTALLAAVDDELNWGHTLYEAIHSWLQDVVTPSTCAFLANIDNKNRTVEPSNQSQAYKLDYIKWRASETREVNSLIDLDFSDIVDESSVPTGHPILPCKWVYKIKPLDEQDDLFKSRVCIMGCYQIEGVDYGETFAPVAKLDSIRLFIALTILWDLKPIQADVPSAFVRAPLEEEVYMRSIPGHELPKGKVYKLKVSLYGLKQSSRNWNKLFVATIQELELIQLREDNCLFIFRGENGDLVILAIYVDDVYLATSNDRLEARMLGHLKKVFGIIVLGLPKKLLGLTCEWERDADIPADARFYSSCKISIPTAIDKIVRLLEIDTSSHRDVPANPDARLSKLDCPTPEQLTPETLQMQKLFRVVAGSGIWINSTCRPDISFAVNQLCKFMSNPGFVHFQAAIWLIRYLSGTKHWGIKYIRKGNKIIDGWADADLSGDELRHSLYSYLFMLASAPISWRVGSQNRIALSTCESEVRAVHAMKEAAKQAMWYNKICFEIRSDLTTQVGQTTPLRVHEDNEACIAYSRNPVRHSTMKHLERDLYWIQEAVARGELELIATPTKYQWADIGTKPLGPTVLHFIRSNIMHP